MLRHPAGRDQHDVEAELALGVIGAVGEPELGGGGDAALCPLGHGFGRGIGARARLDLDEDERAAPAGDDIDFAEEASSSAGPRCGSPWR